MDGLERTTPLRSRWDQEGAEFIDSDREWVTRCCTRLLVLYPGLATEDALDIAQDLSLDDMVRALSPEKVVEDLRSEP